MNEQAIKDAYSLFVQNGYNKSIEDFKQLISTNSEALQDVHNLFTQTGYSKDLNSFKSLMGIGSQPIEMDKKKEVSASGLVSGSLELPKSPISATQKQAAESTMAAPKATKQGVTGTPSDDDSQGWLLNMVSSFDKGVYQNLIGNPVKGLGTLLQGATAKITGGDGKGFISDALIKFGDSYNKMIDDLTPQDEEFKGSLSDQFGRAFGQVGALVLTGGATGAASKGTALAAQAAPKATATVSAAKQLVSGMANPTSVSAALSMGQSEFDRAKEAGATDEQAFEAFYKNAITGSILERIPVMHFLERFNKASAGGLVNYIKTKGVEGLKGGIEEMTTEVLQQVYANATAKDIYDINQELFEGVGESGGVGFGVGFLLNSMLGSAKLLRKQGKTQEADVIEAQVESFQGKTNEATNPAPSPGRYTVNKLPIPEREVVEEMIMTGPIDELISMNLEIENDDDLKMKFQKRVVEHSIGQQIKQANPNLSDEVVSKIVPLESELQSLQGNTTQTGKDRANELRTQIKSLQENAVQEQAAGQVPVQSETISGEEVAQGESRTEPQVVTQESNQGQEAVDRTATKFSWDNLSDQPLSALEQKLIEEEENLPGIVSNGDEIEIQRSQSKISALKNQIELAEQEVSSKTPTEQRVNIAPFFNTTVANREEARALREKPEYKAHVQTLKDIARKMGINANVIEGIGGYKNDAGEEIVEISNVVVLDNAGIEAAEEYAALAAALAPQVQEASIAAQYIGQGAENHNANEYNIAVSDVDGALEALKEAGIKEFSVNEETGTVSFIDVLDFADDELQNNIGRFLEILEEKNISYEQSEFRPVESRYVDKGTRKKILGRVKSKGADLGQSRQELREAIDEAVRRDAEFQGVAEADYFKPAAGNRLFNEPVPEVAQIASGYFRGVFGKERPEYFGSRQLDEAKSKQIADAFEAMEHNPNDPEVKEAYEALAKEVVAQYDAITNAGYFVEVNNSEPYDNSDEMIKDVRDNKRIKIFSTESGFGDNPITAEQRAENPLLADSGKTDVNGVPLLVNDLFRAVHDFFGHSELGNSFGPKGEENAWNVHARMFSPLARKAMTTETRGQNSFVNFSGVNEEIEQTRDMARKLRQQGRNQEAKALVNEIYEKASFAKQKVGLLPEQFYQIDENDKGDSDRAPAPNVEQMMTADTTEQTNLERVLSFLDRAEQDLDAFGRGTMGVNIAIPVIKAIIKTVKALVKGGITLQEAIRRAAAENSVSEEDVVSVLNQLATQTFEASKVEGTSELELPGYNRLMSEAEGVIDKSLERGLDEKKATENAVAYVQGSRVYQDATDVQREQLVRDTREILSIREKSAPKADRLLGKEKTIITMSEMDALKSQLRMEAITARMTKSDMNAKRRALADVVRKMASTGVITAKKAATLLNKISKLNLYNNEMVERFIDYAGKVFADAEYGAKLSIGNATRKRLRKLSKNKDKSANLRALASKFVEIDPSMTENIDEYNKVVSMLLESLVGSTIRGSDVRLADVIREDDAMAYISEALDAQQKKLYEMKIAEIQALLGVDATGLRYEDLLEILSTDKKVSKDNEALVRATIERAFNVYAAAIDEMIRTGQDLFTGEDIDFTDNQKKVVKDFMSIDLNIMKPKDALMAVDALLNFIQNGSTAKMEAVYRKNVAEANIIELAKQGVRAEPLRKYFSERLGRLLTEQLSNLNVLFERMFKGFSRGGMVERLSGITDLKNGKAKAQAIADRIVESYVDKFFKRTANGQAFNTAFNSIERGMTAFVSRTVMGTDREMKAEFDRRKGLVEQSIAALMTGNKKEQEKGRAYQEVYDKILVDSDSYEQVVSKVDDTNMEAIDFWRQEWADKFEELSNVSLNVYNKILDKDFNYVPDRFVNLSTNTGKIDLTADEMAFHINNGTMYKKSTGVLMEATRPTELPQNENNEEPGMFIDLSFDKANANAMYDALVDVNTAAAIRQVDAFIKSSRLKSIIPSPEDIRVLQRRVNLFVNNIRNKNPYTEDELSEGIRKLNRIATFGVSQALGGVLQPLKQVVPVAMNTLINAKALDISSAFDKSKSDFINRSGYSIANRGVESQAQIDSLNKLLDEAANGKTEQIFKALEKANSWYLKAFLVKPDIFIARASWMTYYEQSLVEQGVDPDSVDYDTHEVNNEAADYAQRMVDRQQNVSDSDLAGKLLSEKDATKQLLVKMLMPFASFRMNQSARLGSDIAVVLSNTSTVEDKKLAMRSLAGFGVEMATFRLLSTGIAVMIASAVKSYMDREDDEEKDKKKLDSIVKGQATGTVNDLLSPAPLLDKAIQMAFGTALDKVQDLMEIGDDEKISIYTDTQQTFVQSLGLFGITADRAMQVWELVSLSAGGSYDDKYGREKYLSENDKEALKPLVPVSIMIGLGLMPSEINSFTRSAISDAKRNASTKEGGKDSNEEQQEVELKGLKEERLRKKEDGSQEKIEALRRLKQDVTDPEVLSEISKMIREYGMSPEDRKASKEERAEEKRQRDAELDKLLKGYDNKSEMKRYDPEQYEESFGERSPYYEKNKAKIEAEKLLRKKVQELEDEERNYTPIQKQKKKLRDKLKRN